MIRLPLVIAALVGLWWLRHIPRRRSSRITLVVIAVVVALPLSWLLAQWSYELYMMVRAGRIRSHLESYRASHGEYPIALS
jgi:hypothetical protein